MNKKKKHFVSKSVQTLEALPYAALCQHDDACWDCLTTSEMEVNDIINKHESLYDSFGSKISTEFGFKLLKRFATFDCFLFWKHRSFLKS